MTRNRWPVALALVLAACNPTSGTTPPPPPSTEAVATAPAVTATAAPTASAEPIAESTSDPAPVEEPKNVDAGPEKPPELKILFVGNSVVAWRSLPEQLAELAASGGHTLKVRGDATSKWTLETHAANADGQKRIKLGHWDWVVLQEETMRPLREPDKMFEAARALDKEIHAAKAKTAFFETWAHTGEEANQPAISAAYTKIATELKAKLVPVGATLHELEKRLPKQPLVDADGTHPTTAGTYLAACMFYAALLNASPIGLAGPLKRPLPPEDVKAIQAAAWTAVHGK